MTNYSVIHPNPSNSFNYSKVTEETEYSKEFKKKFCEMLNKIVNENIIPKYGKDLMFGIHLGLWTSDQYGSYKIQFTKDKKEVCYIIADTIMGEWSVYENKN
jgi:hypothetical protein